MRLPKSYEIIDIRKESSTVKTFFFKGKMEYSPGQFVMLWLPDIDEKPFALSYVDDERFGVTIEQKGAFTREMHKLKAGAKLYIKGAFGNGFRNYQNKKSIVVVGGLGMAPALELIKHSTDNIIIQGAKSKEFLLFREDKNLSEMLKARNHEIVYCTDDGSFGEKAFTTELLEKKLKKNKVDNVFTCGPEIMINKVFDICEKHKVECQASLERFMKCGIGICGSCCINDQLVCKDGPVFDSGQLRKLTELGKFARLKSGKKVGLKEYYG